MKNIENKEVKNGEDKLEYKDLSRRTKELIHDVIEDTGYNNRNKILFEITERLMEQHKGYDEDNKNLEYQLGRMKLENTGKILQAIDTYMYFHKHKSKKKAVVTNEEKTEEL